ncbi:PDDEXK nuclease domain-containing protein [Terrimonas pollutisoli]|uniref:PDDEXK nuclease domain-containing protein n=1 Tax=Terrimonas pollutisoli TaxID=3034147 RepID=UPI0023EBFA41|nr:PDDEXK nuclease domain-containing protein [Terrimonas sp. H1YJ31]
MNKSISDSLFNSIKSLIEIAKSHTIRSVNATMVFTYFHIGRLIVEKEQGGRERAIYAKQTLKKLSERLIRRFGRGYSVDNLQYMRLFFLEYSNSESPSRIFKKEKGKPIYETMSRISAQEILSWSHYIQLLKINDRKERNFYELETTQNNWSVRELQRQYNSSLYERLALSTDKKGVKKLARKGQILNQPTDALKSPYVLEFLGLKEDSSYSENELETAIIDKLEHFLTELGKGFLFAGRQKRITLDGKHFHIDLVFYNRLIRSFTLLDLKIGELTHQDIGQMQMYVNYYDRKIKLPDENSTIGIILCKEENKTVVEFTLPEDNKTIFAKEYKLYLPSKEQLRKQLE